MLLSFNENIREGLDFEFAHRMGNLLESLPVRISAFHVCTDNVHFKAFNAFRSVFLKVVERQLRARFRVHVGKYQESKLYCTAVG